MTFPSQRFAAVAVLIAVCAYCPELTRARLHSSYYLPHEDYSSLTLPEEAAGVDSAQEPEEAALHASVSASALAEDVRELGSLLQQETVIRDPRQAAKVQRSVLRSASAAETLSQELKTLREVVAQANGLGLSQVSTAINPNLLVDEYGSSSWPQLVRLREMALSANDTATDNETVSDDTNSTSDSDGDDSSSSSTSIIEKILTINGRFSKMIGIIIISAAGLLLLICTGALGLCFRRR
mmetsp:Transcript_8451/g.18956  ORF Transcript_8451/g.18956 Transcript_8451/m.18956 type:complete len:239 (-) Transcript_8451:35-751(-)